MLRILQLLLDLLPDTIRRKTFQGYDMEWGWINEKLPPKRGVTFKFASVCLLPTTYWTPCQVLYLMQRTLGFGLCFGDHTRQMILLKTIISYDGTYQKLTEILKYFINIKNIKNKSIIQINVNIIFYEKYLHFQKFTEESDTVLYFWKCLSRLT